MAGKILIVDDVATNRIILKAKLTAACYATLQAGDGATALRMARAHVPDLILLDVMLPDMDGIAVCERLRADPQTRDIPIIIISAVEGEEARMRALRAGAVEFLSKPLDEVTLLARLRSLLRAREATEDLRLREDNACDMGFAEPGAAFNAPGRIALIAASHETANTWRDMLKPHLNDELVVADREDVLTETSPSADIYVIAADLVQLGDGLRLMSDLRSRSTSRHAAICMVLPDRARDTAAMALDLGANDLVPENFSPQEFAHRLRTQLRQKRDADRLRASVRNGLRAAVRDPLTGLYNRRYALPHLSRVEERARETGRSYAVMVIDLDRFKQVNDTWGHAAGDAVLVALAGKMRQITRSDDLVARIGGEEFLVVMPDTGLETASRMAERLRAVVEAHPIVLPHGGEEVRVTLSIGLAVGGGRGGSGDAEALMARADRALLAAKAEGRNQVTVSEIAA